LVTFDPTNPGGAVATAIDGGNDLTGVSCPSTSQCTAVDNAGQQVTFNPTHPNGAAPTSIGDGGSVLNAVSCPSTGLCVAVDADGNAIEDDAGTWTLEPISGAGDLFSVACSSATQCVVADVDGDMALGTFVGPPPPAVPVNEASPTISGALTVGDTLSEGHGSWTNGPTGYTYQWALCNSAGGACVAISGANAQTYTLVAGDAGSTLKVSEAASNGGGTGNSATSGATAVVVGPVVEPAAVPAPPGAKLLKEDVSSKHHDVTFHFKTIGDGTRYECAIVLKPTKKHAKTPKPKYSACGSSKTYKKLKPGKYTFYVRAIGPGGIGGATDYHFTIH
jgi:hypothetical protein